MTEPLTDLTDDHPSRQPRMRFTLVLPRSLYAQLAEHARDRGDSMQTVIRAALREYLPKRRRR